MLPCPPKAPSGRMLSRKPAYCWQAGPDTRIFSPLTVAGLCVPIGRYMYLFKRLTAVSAGRFYRFVHIVTYSSGKVVAKSAKRSLKKICVRILEYQPLRQSPGLKVPTEPRPKSSSSVTALCGIGRGPVGAGKINPLSWAGQADSEPTGLVFQESTRS